MKRISRDQIHIAPRQRAKHDPNHILSLRDSISSKGLLHPPVVRPSRSDDGTTLPYVLVAGEGRLAAISKIAEDGGIFLHHDEPFQPGEIPATFLSDLTPAQYAEAEFEENYIRSDLPWPDRCKAIAEIHALRTAENPSQTIAATARELADSGGIIGVGEGSRTVTHPDWIAKNITTATVVAKHLDDPAVKGSRNANEAFQLILDREEKAYAAQLLLRSQQTQSAPPEVTVRRGDLVEILPSLEAGTFDLILADPPYGNEAGSPGARTRTILHHNYDDSPEAARTVIQHILIEGFRVAKPRANLFLFSDIDLWAWITQTSLQAGWTPFRTPILWQKSKSEGLAPWGRSGFRRTYDLIFFATKGQRGLIQSPVDILSFPRVHREDREYAAEKPIELLSELINASTLPGDVVLDPCCGGGSTLAAARVLKRRALGIEKDEDAFNLALTRINEPVAPESHPSFRGIPDVRSL